MHEHVDPALDDLHLLIWTEGEPAGGRSAGVVAHRNAHVLVLITFSCFI